MSQPTSKHDDGDLKAAEARFGLAWFRDRASILAGLAISIVTLGACIWWALGQPAPQFPTSASSIGLLALAVLILVCSLGLRGFRWGVILRRAAIETEPAEPYALIAVGYMGNTVLPFRGGEALRVVLLRERSNVGWGGAVGAIIPERVLDLISLVTLLVLLVATGVIRIAGGIAPALVMAGGLLAAAAALLIYRWLRGRGHFAALAERIEPLVRASRPLFSVAGARLYALSLLIWTIDGSVYWLVAESLELGITPLEGVGLAVVAAAFSIIPAGPAFAGTYDAALLFSLGALSVPAGAAVAYVLLIRSVIFIPITLAGLAVVVLRYGGIARLRAELSRREHPPPSP